MRAATHKGDEVFDLGTGLPRNNPAKYISRSRETPAIIIRLFGVLKALSNTDGRTATGTDRVITNMIIVDRSKPGTFAFAGSFDIFSSFRILHSVFRIPSPGF